MNVVFYDGVCGFCNGFVNWLLTVDKNQRFYFASLQSDYALSILSKVDDQVLKLDSIVFIDSVGVHSKSQAVFRILSHIGGAYGALGAMGLLLPRLIADLMYDVVARYRYLLGGKVEKCRLPSKEEVSRFLD